ncbi:MAG: lipoyl(octanoyl) transferase LipB [Rickettsiales bacterium]|nr:lipoyl(octanoyl) transferase LipB [Rickettsiales bacterium]
MPEWITSPSLIDYETAHETMLQRVEGIINGEAGELLWALEHPPLYTAGSSAQISDLLTPEKFPVYDAGRGGQYTYHGPGQRIVYTMLNLKARMQPKPDIRRYVCLLEEWIINSLARCGVTGERREGRIGIWVVQPDGRENKIAALGIRVKKWVCFHGIAINVSPDLSHFSGIVPCGIHEHGVTSLSALGKDVSMDELDIILKEEFEKLEWVAT